ncbi:MAG: hypothetical protein HYS77_04905 [Candidatus Rokubacteria bacterium]|nr:hypothetical protein [Candidatus Rokubacteria bacterium]MBI2014860.1 hypothetical protein [Candidatus Rokubacteria bacterium]
MVRHESSRGGEWAGLFLTLLAASLGLPVPEEIPVVAAGVLASQALVRWWSGGRSGASCRARARRS